MGMQRKQGNDAEQFACDYLQTKGLILIDKNWRYYTGEIDLIMNHDDDIVFVEVRSRSKTTHGNPIETISKQKQHKIIKTALFFLQRNNWMERNCRFDVISITHGKLEWIKNAFTLDTV
ncbi:MAG: YraN family protein [Gammaproteobacteria bacterium]|nr:YraN family protein [Gammaproteobacteria bacterium]